MKVRGGRAVYGCAIGILVLDTRFPRIPGDPANASTYDFPVAFRVIKGATVEKVVAPRPDPSVLDLLVEGARDLESMGVKAIMTTCGFLISLQDELAAAVKVPVFTSSLLQIPLIWRMTHRRVGILTANSKALTQEHLRKAGATPEMPISVAGMEEKPEFRRVILENGEEMDVEKVEAEVVEAASQLVEEHPDIGAILFECTNLAPYSAAVQEAVKRPVFDFLTLTRMVYDAVSKGYYWGIM